MSKPVRARVQTLHESGQLNGSNINRTCVQYFHQFRTYLTTLTWDDTAACVQINPSPAERGIPRLAAALPAVPGTTIPTDWPAERFDLIWSFTMATNPGGPPLYRFSQIPQLILDGDLIG